MVKIKITDEMVKAKGHAENSVICAMFSAICTMTYNGLVSVGDDAVELGVGRFAIDRRKVQTPEGRFLVGTLIDSMETLAEQYPNSFRVQAWKTVKAHG